MGFGPDHLKIKADLWFFTEQRGENRKARCCVCNKAKGGTFTSISVVVLGCKNFLAGKMCGECFPRMKALWERNGMIINEAQAVDVASSAQEASE